MDNVSAVTAMIAADQVDERREIVFSARRMARLHAFPKFGQDSTQDKGNQPESKDRSWVHPVNESPNPSEYQRGEEWNPHGAAQRTGSLLAPGEQRGDSHQEHEHEEERPGHSLEVWGADGDLGAGDKFANERKDRAPENGKGHRNEQHVL